MVRHLVVALGGTAIVVAGLTGCSGDRNEQSAGGSQSSDTATSSSPSAVVLTPDASKVTSVGLGNVNGVVMGYQDGAPGGQATATKDGQTYTITGTATGIDMANPLQPITKPFEVKVTCP